MDDRAAALCRLAPRLRFIDHCCRARLRDPTSRAAQTQKMGWCGTLSARCLRTILSTSGLHDVLYVHTVCSYGNTTGHTVTLGLTKTALAPASNKSRSAQIQATPRAPLYPMPVGRRSACPPGQIDVVFLALPALPCVPDPVARPLAAVGPRTTICMYSR